MNCWKSINFKKEFGLTRIYTISFLISLLTFIFLYVPLSIIHGTTSVNESGIILFGIAFILLPAIHSFMHILPLIMTNKRAKTSDKAKKVMLPNLMYYPKSYLSKQLSLMVALAPTLFITIPGIVASYLFVDYYVYILLFTAFHIGISFSDFLYVIHITKAPKKALIENENDGFTILVKAQE
ncbi:DUF3267 domain-containing protein [Virgibacillus dakarensis]|uniref:DUF3267 domain-containing protein n=1 Tax=Virgibacillus dakarensis TaxID=1917889 RepID=UPI000B453C99|nr:DUF3267 domain-containing protein [Virgibacillus dakarensis]MBT2218216.1 DUF3267 domain-containing protein [Virgibacillus dakarensis]MTW85509.1 DUF3267 domain-containing protein [Virgibacillus dakarensis]